MTFEETLTPYQRRLLLEKLLNLMTPEERAKILTPGVAPKMPPDISLEELRDRKEITQRTLHDVYETSPKALMNIRFIGKSAYSEIVDILREHEYDVSTFELWNGKKVDNT